ncbi:2816_t:CDS:2 [Ambispora leptoticha]|uniref:2816_t:CDS:1 n=1 Tax=Ambispora leptoticha TaxID=144679 RepID=A0A9N9CGG6_9GLOM|nr:2816_t:CDS:2 [Ambispora leptoticha]
MFITPKPLTEQDYINCLEQFRWNGKVVSPFDPTSKVYSCANNWYKCKNTGRRFNVRTGTFLKGSISVHQLVKKIKVDIKTTHFIITRLNGASERGLFNIFAEVKKDFKKLTGTVEIDETRATERGKDGRTLAFIVDDTKRKTLEELVRVYIEEKSEINSDENPSYNNLGK